MLFEIKITKNPLKSLQPKWVLVIKVFPQTN